MTLYKVSFKETAKASFRDWDSIYRTKRQAQTKITRMRAKFKEVGWKPIPRMAIRKLR